MPKFTKILCIDVGGTYTKYCLVNINKPFSFSLEKKPTVTGRKFLSFIKNIIAEYNRNDFDCISIGFPGIVTEKGELKSQNINVKNISLTDISSDKLTFAANDIYCNALAQVYKKKGKKSSIIVVIGTSVAMAFIYKDKIITGRNNIFGEISDIGFELGMLYLKNNNLTDFTFINNPSNPEYAKYFDKVFELIKLISAIFAPDQIVFGGGVVFHHWNSEFRLKTKEGVRQLFPMYRPKVIFQQEKNFDNIKGISLLPSYVQLQI